ncbi:MAG: trehalose-6-phosphate synthase [Chloroflexi bacterium]|nr:trehalose-6-phosphate synthase [Chloroflexota bacterium]MCI0870134.1 trehalose-6-phosphate synthase [Chloroflexota bacterium]
MVVAYPSDPRKEELVQLCEQLVQERRLIIVSNRGPVEHQLAANGQMHGRRGTGGIVTSLNTLTYNIDFTWVASAMGEGDRAVTEASEGASIKSPIPGQRLSLRYVVTPRRVYHKYYNVFCNPLLWFLQHYMWSSPYTPNVDGAVHDAWENGYVAVNKAFADCVIAEAQDSESAPYVVVHDYHLYLVPLYVRQAVPDATIFHFVHIPWPSPAYWLLLPSYIRNSICRALCQNDIVGFQCLRDARAFLQTCQEFLPDAVVNHDEMTVELDGREVNVRVYPLSIDPSELRRIADSPRSMDYERRLQPLCLENTIVRVDRLEPSKNIVRGFRAYNLLLERHPELHEKVTFLAFLAPSRTRVRQYQRYAEEVEQHVQNVNNTYGTDTWTPIHTFYENNYTQAIAGLRLYDVLLVNPVIDGMNLVAKEGPVVNTKEGMVVLSESVGAHDQLRGGALSVSPTDIEGTMQAMHSAIVMPPDERTKRWSSMYEVVEREDVTHWLKLQIEDMMNLN